MLLLTNYTTMIKNDVWRKLLGYDPGKELKAQILAEVEAEKLSLEEACARYAMPPVYIGEPAEDYDNPFRPALQIMTHKKEK